MLVGKQNKSTNNPKQVGGRFIEISRTNKIVRVYNPQNKQQYVDVKQIVALTMKDKYTGETWVWKQ